jgi:type IX secretion system PorP/SprF family membrane protein
LAINPAYAGSHEALSVTAFARKQWLNIEGAPLSASFTGHSSIKHEKMGLGLILSNDNISIFNQTTLSAMYSYRIHLSEKNIIAMGLQAGFNNYTVRYSQLTSKTANDPTLPDTDYSNWSPNFGTGIYFYNQKFYAGVSVPYLASKIIKTRYVAYQLEQKNNYFLTTGYVFKVSSDLKFKPSVLLRYISGNPMQADLNANLLFREVLWAGISYRTSKSLVFLLQANVTDQLRLGYSFDASIGKTPSFNNTGSHEVMVNYLFSFTKTKVDNPRYF